MQIIVEPCPMNTMETFWKKPYEKTAAANILEQTLGSEAVIEQTRGSEEILITLDDANSAIVKLEDPLKQCGWCKK